MRTALIVDGYNIINAWPELAELKSRKLEEARDKLLEIMINYAGFTGQEVVIVYDAHQVKGASGFRESFHGVEVVFSREGETADEVIERIVGEYTASGDREVYVATSDWIEQRIIFGKGAYRLPARELYQEVEKVLLKLKQWGKGEQGTEGFIANRVNDRVRKLLENWRRRK